MANRNLASSEDAWLRVLASQRFKEMGRRELQDQDNQRFINIFACSFCEREKSCLRDFTLPYAQWMQLGQIAADLQKRLELPKPSGDPLIDTVLEGLVYPYCGLECQELHRRRRQSRR